MLHAPTPFGGGPFRIRLPLVLLHHPIPVPPRLGVLVPTWARTPPSYGEVGLLNSPLSFLSRRTFLDQSHLEIGWHRELGSKKSQVETENVCCMRVLCQHTCKTGGTLILPSCLFLTPPPNALWSGVPGTRGSNGSRRPQSHDYINVSCGGIKKDFVISHMREIKI